MSYFLAIFLLLILAALAAAGFFLVRQRPEDNDENKQPKVSNITKALTIRIGLSVALFLCILISWKMGWIKPTGIPR